VQGKEAKQDMAKTTRKTDAAPAEKKPAVRRPRAASTAAGTDKPAVRRTRKPSGEAPAIPAVTEHDVANVGQPVQAPAIPSEPTHDEIALRAWRIYENRGGGHGQAMSDWLEAKRQLLTERGRKT
jgi:hypothetical protein